MKMIKAGGGWRDIATAPKDKPILLGLGRMAGSGRWRQARPWSFGPCDFYADGADLPMGATHWQPLPKGPKA